MKINRLSLRTRIFIAMIFTVVIASVLIAIVATYQYTEQSKDYHRGRLLRKENTIRRAIEIELKRTNYPVTTAYLDKIFKEEIYDLSKINQLDIFIFDLNGKLILTSIPGFKIDSSKVKITKKTLNRIEKDVNHRITIDKVTPEGIEYQSAYVYLFDNKLKTIGILHLHYINDNSFQKNELKEFLFRLAIIYFLILLLAITISYFISKYITKSLEYVSRKMKQTGFDKGNKKITLNHTSQEIHDLVNSYNYMIDQLQDSAVKLAQIERKHAWREMAKQVAHEIKNPLTPMRLTVQSFEHNFDPSDPDIKQKLHDYSESIIQQIDTMSSIASAFSNFAEMPIQKKEDLNVVEEVKKALDIFHEPYIYFHPEKNAIKAKLDKIQLTRIVTNLVTNAMHALKNKEVLHIDVRVFEKNDKVIIEVEDNGSGILKEDAPKIFEPKFTTKNSGMGLGLPMIKNIVEAYNGEISFSSIVGKGTIFKVVLPKN